MPTCRAIVLSRENFGEADSYIQFLTKDWGIISTMAKAARKSRRRYAGGLDLFCHNEISIRGNPLERPYLNELKVLNPFLGLRQQVDRTMSAGRLVQWIRKLCKTSEAIPEVYSLLGQCLALLEKESSVERIELLEVLFKTKLLSLLGIKPRVDSCDGATPCPAKEVYFDLESGGVICRFCAGTRPLLSGFLLRGEERRFLATGDQIRLKAWDSVQLGHRKTQHLHRIVHQFAQYHTHTRLPSGPDGFPL
jgi:DNA repair protein RecO (recombination protein O)